MGGFLIFITAFVLLICIISWGFRNIISWLFRRKYNVSLKIGSIRLPYLKLCDIYISKNGFSIHIDEVSIKSSFLNSELTKLVTLVVKDVRINKDIGENSDFMSVAENSRNSLDFRDKKIPHFINTFAQVNTHHRFFSSHTLIVVYGHTCP
jgi:hypothetical protein